VFIGVKELVKNLFLMPVLVAALGLMLPGRAAAQTFTPLYNFTSFDPDNGGTNSDGAYPTAGLILSSNTLYGTTGDGGTGGDGSVFAVNTDGSGFTNLYIRQHPVWNGGERRLDGLFRHSVLHQHQWNEFYNPP
jgi:uncharacterized repeat protein (TIGR03803 family)